MAEDQDQSDKTEEATSKKLADAMKKGDVAKSQEISALISIMIGTLVLAMFSNQIAGGLKNNLTQFFEIPHLISTSGRDGVELLRKVAYMLLGALMIPLGLAMFGGVFGNIIQHAPVFTAEKIKPKLSKISPLAGAKRLFGLSSLVNLGKGFAKLSIVAAMVFVLIWPDRDKLGMMVSTDVVLILPIFKLLALRMLGGVIAIMVVIAIIDFTYQKYDFAKRQKMTKQEIKDEHKQADGDPQVKAKIRQVRMERAKKRMMAAVPEATVVIANPTHFAVALKYESGISGAPKCVAKGVDALALRIREKAEEHGVPVVENPPLARALYASVDLDEEIPPDHYKAVAEVIGFVMRLGGRSA